MAAGPHSLELKKVDAAMTNRHPDDLGTQDFLKHRRKRAAR